MRPEYPNFNVFVLTLPRCYSSITVKILEQLGVNMVYDTEDPLTAAKRIVEHRGRFGDFEMNETFGEIVNNWDKCAEEILGTPYSGCKMIIPNGLNGRAWKLITTQPAKVIMMWRDPEEIRESQNACYIRPRAPMAVPEDPNEQRESEVAYFESELFNTKLRLDRRKDLAGQVRFHGKEEDVAPFDYMVVDVNDLRSNPENTINKIAKFIESPLNIWNAIEVFDPAKVRFKGNRNSSNIVNHTQDPRDAKNMVVVNLPEEYDIEEGEQNREQVLHIHNAQLTLEKIKIQLGRTKEEMNKVVDALEENDQEEITIMGSTGDEITMHVEQAKMQITAYEYRIEFLEAKVNAFEEAINKKLEA